MDITMPEMDGIEATRFLQERCPGVRVLVLTVHDNEDYVFEILEAGASGYVAKHGERKQATLEEGATYEGEEQTSG